MSFETTVVTYEILTIFDRLQNAGELRQNRCDMKNGDEFCSNEAIFRNASRFETIGRGSKS